MQIKTSHDIGALIRDRRSQLTWSQEELAKRVGVSRLWMVQLEKGKSTAQISLVLRTLKELGVAIEVSFPTAAPSKRPMPGTVDLDGIIRGSTKP